MLRLTKRTEYGLIALVHLVDQEGVVSAREIYESYPVPKRLIAEVLKDLGRADLVASQRGASGGYSLARDPDDITLGQVVAALEGAPTLTSCESLAPAANGECTVEPSCPIRSPIHRIRERIWQLMERTTLRTIASYPAATILPAVRETLLPQALHLNPDR